MTDIRNAVQAEAVDFDAIRDHHEQVTYRTPAPWRWTGLTWSGGRIHLTTVGQGQTYIMGFARRGMSGAQPTFQVWPKGETWGRMVKASDGLLVKVADHREDIARIDNPHAEYIARAPEYVGSLLTAVDDLRASLAELVRLHDVAGGWAEQTQAVNRARDLLDRIPPNAAGVR